MRGAAEYAGEQQANNCQIQHGVDRTGSDGAAGFAAEK